MNPFLMFKINSMVAISLSGNALHYSGQSISKASNVKNDEDTSYSIVTSPQKLADALPLQHFCNNILA
jgi:hypothetical protein